MKDRDSKGRFREGIIPHNKGKKFVHSGSFKKGHKINVGRKRIFSDEWKKNMFRNLIEKKKNKKWVKPTLVFVLIGSFLVFGIWAVANNFTAQSLNLSIFSREGVVSASGFDPTELNKAEHLDSNKNFISDIYPEVKALDDIWSETIPSDDYVRVTFEKNLTSKNDITLYPRVISGTPKIEVYEADGTEIIAEFTNIISNEYNKVYLTNLDGTQDTFDLKIIGGSVDFDYVIDPSPAINFTDPTPSNNTFQSNTDVYVNVSTSNASNHSAFIDWDRSLRLWMPFDSRNSSGDPTDLSTWSNNGSAINGAVYTSSGIRGDAFSFDGVDDYIVISDSASLLDLPTTALSFSAWVNVKNDGTNDYIFTKAVSTGTYGWTFYVDKYRRAALVMQRATTDMTILSALNTLPVYTNGWFHLAVTYPGGDTATDVNIYVNGAEVSSYQTQTDGNGTYQSDSGHDARIARSGYSAYFNGSLDEVMIFNRALTPEEINASYNAGSYRLFKNFTSLADGNYNYTAHVIDALGYTNQTEQRTVTIDTTYPTWENNKTNLTASTPQGNLVYFNITLNDTNPGTYVFSWYNGTDWANDSATSYTNGQEVQVTKTITADTGDINWTWYFNDTAGNSNQSDVWSVTLTVGDTTPPNVTINTPLNQTYATTSIIFNVTALDETGMGGCLYSLNAGNTNVTMTNSSTSPTYWNATDNNVVQGSSTATFYCNDTANNINNSETVTFFIDSINPEMTFDYPVNISYDAEVTILNYTYTETNPGYCQWSNDTGTTKSAPVTMGINWTGLSSIEGSNTWTVYCNDTLGHTNSTNITFTIDTINPDISITFPSNNTNTTNTNLNVNYTTSDINLASCWYSNDTYLVNTSLATCGTNITTVIWSEGNHNVTVWANDSLGNINNSKISFRIDTTLPTVSDISVNDLYLIETDVAVDGFIATIDFSELMDEGTVPTIGYSPAVATTLTYCDGAWSDGDTYTYTCDIEDANVESADVDIDVSGAKDLAGNTMTADTTTGDNEFSIDTIIPDISILFPNNNTNWTNTNLDVNYTATDTNLASCWYSNDTYLANTSLANCGTNITNVIWSEGQHNVTVWSNDTGGNENNSKISFTIDTTPPYFTNWANQSITEGQSLNYNINADDDGVGLESFAINWTTPFNITIADGILRNSSGLSVGAYYINVSINDTLGNLNSSILLVNVTAISDIEYPLFSNYWDNNASLVDSGTGLFNVTVTSTNGTVWLEIDGTNITATNLTADVYNASYVFSSAGTYTYRWHSWGNGTLANYNKSIDRSYTVNTSDTCTCPAINNDWEVDMSDYCELNTACNLGAGKLSFVGSGYANCSTNINTTNLGDPGSSGVLYVSNGCLINIK